MNIIIDGHGAAVKVEDGIVNGELTKIGIFNFKRSQEDKSYIYFFTNVGKGIRIYRSGLLIAKSVLDDEFVSKTEVKKNSSRIDGAPVQEHILAGIKTDENNEPDWDLDFLFDGISPRPFFIRGIELLEFRKGNTCYIRFKNYNDSRFVTLSEIIAQYPNGQHNFYWMACNDEVRWDPERNTII